MRLAFFSPFNPLKTGVADYSEELLPSLAEHSDVDLVVDRYALSNPAIRDRFRVLTPAQFIAHADRYDMAVYQLANSVDQHGYMVPCMKHAPGITVLHDYYLHFLMLGLTLMKGDMPALKRTLSGKYGGSGSALAHRMLFGLFDPYQVSTTVPLVNMSRGVIMHSRFGERLVSEDAGAKPVRVVPMGIPIRPLLDPVAMKRKYNFADDSFVLASVSTLSHTKRIPTILQAVSRLRSRHPNLKLLILGGGKLGSHARGLIQSLDLSGTVRQTGWMPHDGYWECLNLADAVIDLRYPSGAETSASLLRAMSAAKPVIASKQGSFLELPPDCSQKISVGETETQELFEAVTRLIEDRSLTEQMGSASRRYVETHHRVDLAAQAYVEFIREVQQAPCTDPVEDWFSVAPNVISRTAYSSVYKLSRLVALLKNYGVSDTVRRLRAGTQRASRPETREMSAGGGA